MWGGITTLVCGLQALSDGFWEDDMDLIDLEMAMTPGFTEESEEEKEDRRYFAYAKFLIQRIEDALVLALEQAFGLDQSNWWV